MGATEDVGARLRVLEDTLACWRLRTEWEYTVDIVQSGALPDPWTGVDPVQEAYDHLISLFTDDAVLAVGGGPTKGAYSGKEEIKHYFKNVRVGPYYQVRHCLAQPLIEVNGDTATARWIPIVYILDGSDQAPVRFLSECNDDYVRVGNEWKIKRIDVWPFWFFNTAGTPWATRPIGLPTISTSSTSAGGPPVR